MKAKIGDVCIYKINKRLEKKVLGTGKGGKVIWIDYPERVF